MKTYRFKRGGTWIDSNYPPFDFQWQPKRRFQPVVWLRQLILPWWAEWALFLASVLASCWAIVTALKTIWPGMF